jgi:myosin-5
MQSFAAVQIGPQFLLFFAAFVVRHFADNVEYECQGFLDKNRDTVMEEQIQILKASENDLVSDLFMEGGSDGGATLAVKGKSTPQAKKPQGSGKQNKKTVSYGEKSIWLVLQILYFSFKLFTSHIVNY